MVGYVTDPDFRYVNGWVPSHQYSFISPDDAVHAAALDVLQHTEVIGGDLLDEARAPELAVEYPGTRSRNGRH